MSATRYALAEIDAQCRKAARGAGCPWGLAEEAGKAARWLSTYGLPGAEALAELLGEPRNCRCAGGDGTGPQCALPLGAMLCDRAEAIARKGGFTAQNVARPLLLLPQIGRAAEALRRSYALEWDGFRFVTMPEGIAIHRAENLNPVSVAEITCVPSEAEPILIRPGIGSRIVEPIAWAMLERLAHKTYVPATAASRSAGAGAGLTDND